jgi:hypothetical protein
MSQREVNQVNKVLRAIIISLAAIMAITALIYNPAHLFTAGIIFAAGLEAEFVKADQFDIRK